MLRTEIEPFPPNPHGPRNLSNVVYAAGKFMSERRQSSEGGLGSSRKQLPTELDACRRPERSKSMPHVPQRVSDMIQALEVDQHKSSFASIRKKFADNEKEDVSARVRVKPKKLKTLDLCQDDPEAPDVSGKIVSDSGAVEHKEQEPIKIRPKRNSKKSKKKNPDPEYSETHPDDPEMITSSSERRPLTNSAEAIVDHTPLCSENSDYSNFYSDEPAADSQNLETGSSAFETGSWKTEDTDPILTNSTASESPQTEKFVQNPIQTTSRNTDSDVFIFDSDILNQLFGGASRRLKLAGGFSPKPL